MSYEILDRSSEQAVGDARRFPAPAVRSFGARLAVKAGPTFFFVASLFAYYGQLNRTESGDTWATIYTAVALVKKHTIWLDDYVRLFQQHAGEHPYMVTSGPGGHLVSVTPSASSVLALPVVALFSAFGVHAEDWGAWMEAGMLTAALTAAASAAIVFVLLTRLTTRGRATLIAATYAWGTLQWGISGQALWQHSGATLALALGLLALVDGRLVQAGAALAAMVAFRPNTVLLFAFLLPLVGRRTGSWLRFGLGLLPFVAPLLFYNTIAFGSPFRQGYGTAHVRAQLTLDWHAVLEGTVGLLFSPGRGLFVYSPVLVFAVVGLVRGWRKPLYVCSGAAAVIYILLAANSNEWYGGQSFGPRRLTDILPLLAVLLVPALELIDGTRWLWTYAALFVWSVFVELLGAAAWPPMSWFDKNPPLERYSTWWRLTDNELAAKLQSSGLPLRLTEMALIGLLGLALGYLAEATARTLRRGAAAS